MIQGLIVNWVLQLHKTNAYYEHILHFLTHTLAILLAILNVQMSQIAIRFVLTIKILAEKCSFLNISIG